MMTKSKAAGNYINSVLAKHEVKKAGYDEAIMLTPGGNIAEGSGENIFCVYGRRLITPPLVEVDDRAVGSGKPGPVTRHLLELFQQATVGKLDRYKLWNEFVSE